MLRPLWRLLYGLRLTTLLAVVLAVAMLGLGRDVARAGFGKPIPPSPPSSPKPGSPTPPVPPPSGPSPSTTSFNLFPANAAIAACLGGNATAQATVYRGPLNDTMQLSLSGFPPNLGFDLFTVQRNTAPFGLAWYQSDIETDSFGNAEVTIQTILLDQIFGFTSGGPVPPTNTFHVGFWFNDINQEIGLRCVPPGTPTTPFNGEHQAGTLAFITQPGTSGLGPLCTQPLTPPVNGFSCNPEIGPGTVFVTPGKFPTQFVPVAPGPSQASFDLLPANSNIANCLSAASFGRIPTAHAVVTRGGLNDTMQLTLTNFPPNLAFDLFTVQNNTAPFGLAWYQSDIETDGAGNANVTIQTILLDQIFGFTSGGPEPPTNTFHVGFWFNDINQEISMNCVPPGTASTPFNGEHQAGTLAFITRPVPPANLGPLCTEPLSPPQNGFSCNP